AEVLLGVNDEAVLFLLGKLSGSVDDILDQRCQLHGLWIELELFRLDLRQVEHLVDEAKKVSPSAVHALQWLLRLFCSEARRVFDHHLGQTDDGIERRAQLVAHAGDELRLVLAGLLELSVFLLDFVEQPHVLDRDGRLVSKRTDQLDLLFGEGSRFGPGQSQDANRDAVAQHRHTEHGAEPAQLLGLSPSIFWVGRHIGDMYNLTFQQSSSHDRAPLRYHRESTHIFEELRREAIRLGGKEDSACLTGNGGFVGLAQLSSRFNERLQHRLEGKRRAGGHLEHVGGGGLLLQRLAQLVEQARVLDGNDGLGGETRDQLDLFFGKRPHLSTIDDDGPDRFIVLQHRNRDQRANAGDIDCGNRQGVAVEIGSACTKVGYLDRPPGLRGADEADLRVGMIYSARSQLLQVGLGQWAVERRGPVALSLAHSQRAVAGFAQPRGVREHGSKDRFQLAARTRDDAQHFRCCRLLLQRLA